MGSLATRVLKIDTVPWALRSEVVTLGRGKTWRASTFPSRCFHISHSGQMNTQRRNEFWVKEDPASWSSVILFLVCPVLLIAYCGSSTV